MTTTSTALPVLESGDHLSRAEFHRLYCARYDIKKAEPVEGVAYVGSPLRADLHAEPHATVITWLSRCAEAARRRCSGVLDEMERRSRLRTQDPGSYERPAHA
jgi:hypothetical protein